ncbi:MAG: methyl-accepting chemotaxis protein [Gammaproteobacteria bacterium]
MSVGAAALAIETGDWDGAQAILIKTINPLYRKADGAAAELSALLAKRSRDSIVQVRADIDSATALVLAILAAGLVAGTAAGVFMARSIARPLATALDVARSVARGDLRTAIETGSNNEFGQLLSALKQMNSNLIDIVRDVHAGTETISSSSSQVASGSADLSARTEQQASVLEETAAAMEELTSTVKQNGEHARHATQLAQDASAVAHAGGATVGEMVRTMGEIHASARRIADITNVIDGIAFQTNILALNAAVEAARAGEQGRGFAVVANEVRTLAQRAGSASKEIKELIAASTSKAEAGNRLAAEAGKTMEDVVASVNKVTGLIREIGVASVEQEQGIEQVNVAISEMDSTTQSNARLVEEASEAANALHGQAELLADKVSVFQLPDAAAPMAAPAARRSVPAAPQRRGAPKGGRLQLAA